MRPMINCTIVIAVLIIFQATLLSSPAADSNDDAPLINIEFIGNNTTFYPKTISMDIIINSTIDWGRQLLEFHNDLFRVVPNEIYLSIEGGNNTPVTITIEPMDRTTLFTGGCNDLVASMNIDNMQISNSTKVCIMNPFSIKVDSTNGPPYKLVAGTTLELGLEIRSYGASGNILATYRDHFATEKSERVTRTLGHIIENGTLDGILIFTSSQEYKENRMINPFPEIICGNSELSYYYEYTNGTFYNISQFSIELEIHPKLEEFYSYNPLTSGSNEIRIQLINNMNVTLKGVNAEILINRTDFTGSNNLILINDGDYILYRRVYRDIFLKGIYLEGPVVFNEDIPPISSINITSTLFTKVVPMIPLDLHLDLRVSISGEIYTQSSISLDNWEPILGYAIIDNFCGDDQNCIFRPRLNEIGSSQKITFNISNLRSNTLVLTTYGLFIDAPSGNILDTNEAIKTSRYDGIRLDPLTNYTVEVIYAVQSPGIFYIYPWCVSNDGTIFIGKAIKIIGFIPDVKNRAVCSISLLFIFLISALLLTINKNIDRPLKGHLIDPDKNKERKKIRKRKHR